MNRFAALTCLSLLLAACGFQLRKPLSLPADLGPLRIVSSDPYSPLAQSLSNALTDAGAVPATGESGNDVATLRIVSERWGSLPLSIDARGRAQEYTLRYATIFVLHRADGSVLVPQQAIELSRDYVSSPQNSIGTDSERELLGKELQREMAASILRRIDAAIRNPVAAPEPVPGPEPAQ